VADVLTQYYQAEERAGRKAVTMEGLRSTLKHFFTGWHDRPLKALTPAACQKIYEAAQDRYAVATHHFALQKAKQFLAWCAEQRLLPSSPMAKVRSVGVKRRGKEQLRVEEARKFLALSLKSAEEVTGTALGPALALLLGLRTREILGLQVRDLDLEGQLLWISESKTDAGRRRLEVPEILQASLLRLTEGKKPTDFIIPARDPSVLLRWTWKLCKRAGLPERVCTHSLRGLHATLATDQGVTSHAVMQALGHTSEVIKDRHYLAPGAKQRAAAKAVLQVLEGGKAKDELAERKNANRSAGG
jgi:integrase